jgi:hypothetical protein
MNALPSMIEDTAVEGVSQQGGGKTDRVSRCPYRLPPLLRLSECLTDLRYCEPHHSRAMARRGSRAATKLHCTISVKDAFREARVHAARTEPRTGAVNICD